jgi:hypothetical protein
MIFHYSDSPHDRRHGPQGYRDYRSFKPWLRDEFSFRCAYCLWRERWCAEGADAFSADHLLPQSSHPDLICDYDNLVYACCRCNSVRQDLGVPLDPCRDAFAEHLEVQDDGSIRGLTPEGEEQIRICRLDRPKLTRARGEILQMIQVLEQCASPKARELLRSLHAPPDHLPNLAVLRPPGGNSRPKGIGESYLVQREQSMAQVRQG